MPDGDDYNSAYNLYLPQEHVPGKIKKKIHYHSFDFSEKKKIQHKQPFEPYDSDWPCPFINFYFPVTDEEYIHENGLVGIALGYESTRYNKSVDKVQKRSGLNIVNLDGEAHMMSGVYMIDGVLTSRCFGCGELSDRCLCTVFDNDYVPGVEIDGLSGRSFQFRNSIPRIKGISGQSDYVIMFLDSNKKKETKKNMAIIRHYVYPEWYIKQVQAMKMLNPGKFLVFRVFKKVPTYPSTPGLKFPEQSVFTGLQSMIVGSEEGQITVHPVVWDSDTVPLSKAMKKKKVQVLQEKTMPNITMRQNNVQNGVNFDALLNLNDNLNMENMSKMERKNINNMVKSNNKNQKKGEKRKKKKKKPIEISKRE